MFQERERIESRFPDRVLCQKTDASVEDLVGIDVAADPVRSAHDGRHIGHAPQLRGLRGQVGCPETAVV